MKRDIILGTAGHIDHGKTTLVKALTGIDCDRLPEEKARGITIDLGFAHLDVGDFRIGIVDVPGHERFVKNMLAGATGFDLAMLIIAADDSTMPQTREHLEILKLLDLRHGVIVLTKCDLADEETLQLVEMEARELVSGTFLENAPLIRTAANKGIGIKELKQALEDECRLIPDRAGLGLFRLPIDRSFVVQGHGAVATGTVYSGDVQEGQEVEHLPSGKILRVRSLQSHATSVTHASQGQRCAMNLTGIDHHELMRGQELATPGYLHPSKVISVRLLAVHDLKKPIKHRLEIRLHVGTSETMGTLSLLEDDTIPRGKSGLAQIFLEEPVCTTLNQPFIIRNSSGTSTLGGGHILQPLAPKIRRRHTHSIEMLRVLETNDSVARLKAIGWFMGYEGVDKQKLPLMANLTGQELEKALANAVSGGSLALIESSTGRKKYLDPQLLLEIEKKITHVLDALHKEFPLLSTHERQKLALSLEYVGDPSLVAGIMDGMLKRKILVGNPRRVGLAGFKPKLTQSQRKLIEKVTATYRETKLTPPDFADFEKGASGLAEQLQDLFDICVQEGRIVHIQGGLYLDDETARQMQEKVRVALADGKGWTVAQIRDLLESSRKYAVPYCEFLDRVGVTQREGDLRVLKPQTPVG